MYQLTRLLGTDLTRPTPVVRNRGTAERGSNNNTNNVYYVLSFSMIRRKRNAVTSPLIAQLNLVLPDH